SRCRSSAGSYPRPRRGERRGCDAPPHRRLQVRRHRAVPSAHRRPRRSTGVCLMPRAIICVLDSLGIGGAPDAADYGDEGSATLQHIAANYDLSLPNMDAMGLGAAAELSTGEVPRGLTNAPKGG